MIVCCQPESRRIVVCELLLSPRRHVNIALKHSEFFFKATVCYKSWSNKLYNFFIRPHIENCPRWGCFRRFVEITSNKHDLTRRTLITNYVYVQCECIVCDRTLSTRIAVLLTRTKTPTKSVSPGRTSSKTSSMSSNAATPCLLSISLVECEVAVLVMS